MRKESLSDEPTIDELEAIIEEQRRHLPPWWDEEERNKFRGDDAITPHNGLAARRPGESLTNYIRNTLRIRPGITTPELCELCNRTDATGRSVVYDLLRKMLQRGIVHRRFVVHRTRNGSMQDVAAWYITDRDAKGENQ